MQAGQQYGKYISFVIYPQKCGQNASRHAGGRSHDSRRDAHVIFNRTAIGGRDLLWRKVPGIFSARGLMQAQSTAGGDGIIVLGLRHGKDAGAARLVDADHADLRLWRVAHAAFSGGHGGIEIGASGERCIKVKIALKDALPPDFQFKEDVNQEEKTENATAQAEGTQEAGR